MVYMSRAFLAPKKTSQRWIDSLRIYARGGHGGTGLPRVNGVGGSGGNVYVKAVEKVKDLSEVRLKNTKQRYLAEPGENSV
jgi:GTPase involved in cell partitioning and DNA repair